MIEEFVRDKAFLSNFYPCNIHMSGVWFKSSEHAYQWHKLANPEHRELVRLAASPGKAMRLARELPMVPDWMEIRTGIMLVVVLAKFQQNSTLRTWLCDTSPMHLIEGNKWGDTYWGMVRNELGEWEGENHLGRILMTVRDHLLV